MRDQLSSTIADVTKSVSDNYTETNERVLGAVVENNRKAVEFAVKTADQLGEQFPSFDLPFADRVPTPAQAGDRYLELVERVVEMNREYSERIVKMNREYSDRIVEMLRDEAPAAKKTEAKKTGAKKTAKKTATKVAKKSTTTKAAAAE